MRKYGIFGVSFHNCVGAVEHVCWVSLDESEIHPCTRERLTIENNSLKLQYANNISCVITCRSLGRKMDMDRIADAELSDSDDVLDLLIS